MMFRAVLLVFITLAAMKTYGQATEFHKSNNRVVLVTGAASGIGKATAMKFRKEGYTVYASDIDTTKWKELETIGCNTLYLDVTDRNSIEIAFKEIEKKDKGVDILINNAGYGQYGALENLTIKQFQRQFDVNVYGVIRVTQRALPYMRNKKNGIIMNTSSIAGEFTTPYSTPYASSKHALEAISDGLRAELNDFNIKVILIKPGAVKTNFLTTANQNMPVIQQDNPYHQRRSQFGLITTNAYKEGAPGLLTSKKVADVFYKAATKRKPKTRYRIGSFAKLMPMVQSLRSDRGMDKMILNRMKKESKRAN